MQCGAKKKDGTTCTVTGVLLSPGVYGRCRRHGGSQQLLPPDDPRRNVAKVKHGLYAKYITDSEVRADFVNAEVGQLDEEIRLLRAYCARAVKAAEADPDGVYVTKKDDEGRAIQVISKQAVVQQYIDRIAKLEHIRAEVVGGEDFAKGLEFSFRFKGGVKLEDVADGGD